MNYLRNETQKNFTVIQNYVLSSTNISLKAIGIYCKLISLPDNWNFTEEGLACICKDGKDSIRSALKELEDLNLLYRFRIREKDGTLGKSVYYISAIPMSEENKKEIEARYNPLNILIQQEDEPCLENPPLDTDTQLNTNIYNTNIYNKKNYNKKNSDNEKTNLVEKQFETFYNAYPRKVKKQDVKKWFLKNKPNEELFKTIIDSLELFKKDKDWLKDNGQYIPYPTSWLNQKRWEDKLDLMQEEKSCEKKEEEKQFAYDTDKLTNEEYGQLLNAKNEQEKNDLINKFAQEGKIQIYYD